MSTAKIDDLLVDWELARQSGRELTAEELAGDQTQLVAELRARIAAMKATQWIMEDIIDHSDVHLAETLGAGSEAHETQLSAGCDAGLSTEQFLESIVRSGVLSDAEVAFLRRLVADYDPQTKPHELANRLVDEGLLTAYQASVLLSRKYSPLQLDRYIILDAIGAGGMGLVYKALHRSMERIVALKVLPRHALDSPSKVDRFRREIKAAAKLSHPHIVTAYDAHEAAGVHFLVMEYVPGQDLKKTVMQNGPLPVPQAVTIVAQIADALAEAHRQGIIHRDVKPSNILLSENNEPKLLDLGLARIRALAQQESSNDLTREGLAMGTAAYMAPEQARDPKKVDARADVYSLGCTLYYLVVGRPPLERKSSLETILAHMEGASPSLHDSPSKIPDELEQVFQRMVAKDPHQRYPTMTDLRAALIQTGLVDPQRVTEPARSQAALAARATHEQKSWQRWIFILVVGGLVALSSLWAAQSWFGPRELERDIARWAMGNGGVVAVTNEFGTQKFHTADELPEASFRIVGLEFQGVEQPISLASLGRLHHLQSLRLSLVRRQNYAITDFEALPPLKELALVACQLGDDDLATIVAHQHPTSLDLSGNELTDAALSTIVKLSGIERLNLSNTAVSDYGLKQLLKLPSLHTLWLNHCLVSNTGMSHVADLRELEELSLEGTLVGDAGIEQLRRLKQLRSINLANTRITLAGLEKRLVEVKRLRLSQFGVDGELIGTLLSLPAINELDLNSSNVDDVDLGRLAGKLTQLQRLCVADTLVSAKGVQAFRTALPTCELVADLAESTHFGNF